MALSPSGTPLYTTLVLGPCIKAQTTIYLLGVAQVKFKPKPGLCQHNFFVHEKSSEKSEKRSKTEISGDFGSWGGRDALKFKIDASGGSDYNQRRQKK